MDASQQQEHQRQERPGQDPLVHHALSEIRLNLGILVGARRISRESQEKILAIIRQDEPPTTTIPNMAVSQSTEPSSSTIHAGGAPDQSPKGKGKAIIEPEVLVNRGLSGSRHNQPSGIQHSQPSGSRHNQPSGSTDSPSENPGNIVCPWWATDGYYCKEWSSGKCKFHHGELPHGVNEPLICQFWYDGRRCTKTDEECRFAHYAAQHRQVAPLPTKKEDAKKGDKRDEKPQGGGAAGRGGYRRALGQKDYRH